MADFSISVTREAANRWTPGRSDVTIGTSSPGSGDIELRINRTTAGDITLMDILNAIEKIEYYLQQHWFDNTAPSSGKISADD